MMEGMGELDPALNATQKICAVLRALTGCAPAPLRDLASAAGLNKVTTFRILGTLVQEGFARRPAGTQLYDLGPEVAVLATALAGRVGAFSILALSERITARTDQLVGHLRAAARDTEHILAESLLAAERKVPVRG